MHSKTRDIRSLWCSKGKRGGRVWRGLCESLVLALLHPGVLTPPTFAGLARSVAFSLPFMLRTMGPFS